MRLDISVVLPSGEEIPVGSIDDTGGIVAFEYARDYRYRPDAYALAPALPLAGGEFIPASTRQMPPGLADAQPDAWGRGLMHAIQRRTSGRNQRLSELEVLSRVSDAERLGALRVRRDGTYHSPPEDNPPHLTDLPALIEAARAFERGEEVPADKLALLQAGTSMGGARPKATVINSGGGLAMAKLPARDDFGDAMAWEATCLELARRSGVSVPRFQHHRFEYRSGLVVDRFDRENTRRLGYLSADGMLNKSPGDYVDYLRLVSVLQRNSAAADADSVELFRRVALTLLVNNVDDHMRNHGFLRQRNGWRLAPAFDINPFYRLGALESTPVDNNDDPRDRDIRLLLKNHDAFRLTETAAVGVIMSVEAATSEWREIALSFGISPEALATMADAFDGPNRERARALTTTRRPVRLRTDTMDPQPRDALGRFGRKGPSPPETSWPTTE